jgi:acetoin utilization deacetylase AcuC-like enzyme
MLEAFEAACNRGPGITDFAPTFITRTSYQDAFLAAGATLCCTQAVLDGQVSNAFAIVRPPGHHAEPGAAMGFCLLNNIAIAARSALEYGLERLLIFDFDAHHGNGTQAVFYDEPRVAYFSTHQERIYPFRTGLPNEAPDARGRIINLPLPERSGDTVFHQITEKVLIPLVEKFQPQMMFISAGFDSHWSDPLAELGLSSAGYFALAQKLKKLADEICEGRIVFALEGGYNPVNVASGIDAVLCALTGTGFNASDPSPHPEPGITDRLSWLKDWHGW